MPLPPPTPHGEGSSPLPRTAVEDLAAMDPDRSETVRHLRRQAGFQAARADVPMPERVIAP